MTMANLLSTNVVVGILVSVYRHQQSGYTYSYCRLYTHLQDTYIYYKHKVPNGPFSHSWSHMYIHVHMIDAVTHSNSLW